MIRQDNNMSSMVNNQLQSGLSVSSRKSVVSTSSLHRSFVVTELSRWYSRVVIIVYAVDTMSLKYMLHTKHDRASRLDYRHNPQYASGSIMFHSLFDYIIYQNYHKSTLIAIIRLLTGLTAPKTDNTAFCTTLEIPGYLIVRA